LICARLSWVVDLFGEPRRFKLRALNPLIEIDDES